MIIDDETRESLLDRLREGGRRYTAARELEIPGRELDEALADDPDFRVAVEEAERHADEQVEDALFQAAVSGNVKAIELWLGTRMPEKWPFRQRGGPSSVHAHLHLTPEQRRQHIDAVLAEKLITDERD